jgi:hypothetical protein
MQGAEAGMDFTTEALRHGAGSRAARHAAESVSPFWHPHIRNHISALFLPPHVIREPVDSRRGDRYIRRVGTPSGNRGLGYGYGQIDFCIPGIPDNGFAGLCGM